MTKNAIQLLKSKGPLLSSALCEMLVGQGLSPEAARQQISRAVEIKRLNGIKFPHNSNFLFLDEHQKKDSYWKVLAKQLIDNNVDCGAALFGIIAKGGIILKSELPIVSGCPTKGSKRNNHEKVAQLLIANHLVQEEDIIGHGTILRIRAGDVFPTGSVSYLLARRTAEDILLNALKEWLRKNSIVSFDKTVIRDGGDPPMIGQYSWSLTAPSYLLPFRRRRVGEDPKVTPGIVGCDVLVDGVLDERHTQHFVNKVRALHAHQKISFMPILIGAHFTSEALFNCKKFGIMIATINNFLGQGVAEALNELIATLRRAAEVAISKPEMIGALFQSLGKIEGASQRIRGPLFEMITANLVSRETPGNIEINKIVYSPKTHQSAEVDVFVETAGSVIISIECKGKLPSALVSKEEIDKWITQTIPRVRDYLLSISSAQSKKHVFEFWTTSDFHPEALQKLKDFKENTKKFEVNFFNGKQALLKAKQLKAGAIVDYLNEYYLKHPLSFEDF